MLGGSKRCCPACAIYLKTLMRNRNESFIVRGNHNTISGCTLPPWTPSGIVGSMNETFGLMLRQYLVTLMKESERVRSRCKSTGSETLSIDSSEGSGRFVTHILSPYYDIPPSDSYV